MKSKAFQVGFVVLAATSLASCCDSKPGASSTSPPSTTITSATGSSKEESMPPIPNADPAIESVIRKLYEAVGKGDGTTVLQCLHPEIAQQKGKFESGYSPGRSAEAAQLLAWADGVKSDGDKVSVTNLRVDVIKQESERALAWARYRGSEYHLGTTDPNKGKYIGGEWDAKDYVILKKFNGQWRVRRVEDRAGRNYPLDQQDHSDPWGGVK